jgi:hypothetical protein
MIRRSFEIRLLVGGEHHHLGGGSLQDGSLTMSETGTVRRDVQRQPGPQIGKVIAVTQIEILDTDH